jgi:hypothetical protein
MELDEEKIILSAQRVLKTESKAIDLLARNLPTDFPYFIQRILSLKGTPPRLVMAILE